MIYLDNGATTYPKPEEVYRALDVANRTLAFNAGRGSYHEAKQVAEMIEETRQMVADLINGTPNMVSFESSATEALNIIINGIDWCDGDTVYISPFEHNAVVRPLYNVAKRFNITISIIPFNKETWQVELEELNNLFVMKKPKAVFLSQISNVTGLILPYSEIFKLSRQFGAINTLDASQGMGVINPSTEYTDFIVFAGHKSLYASFGIAGFCNVTNHLLNVTKSGGTGSDSLNHEMPERGYARYESGSINSVSIAGLNASLKWLKETKVSEHEKKITQYLIDMLKPIKKAHVYLPKETTVFGIVSINVDGYPCSAVGSILSEEYNICVRTGYHCSPFVHDFLEDKSYGGTVRISIGAFTEDNDINKLVEAISTL